MRPLSWLVALVLTLGAASVLPAQVVAPSPTPEEDRDEPAPTAPEGALPGDGEDGARVVSFTCEVACHVLVLAPLHRGHTDLMDGWMVQPAGYMPGPPLELEVPRGGVIAVAPEAGLTAATAEAFRRAGVSGLDLDQSGLAPGLEHVEGLTTLTHVIGTQDGPVDDAGLARLGRVAALRHLELYGEAISNTGLGHLGRLDDLEVLMVSGLGPGVTDRALERWTDLPHLRFLDLRGPYDPEAPRLRLGDDGAAAIARLAGLEQLSVELRGASDAALEALGGLAGLTELTITGAVGIGGEGLVHLTRLRRLERLSLVDATGIGDEHLGLLGGLERLRFLDLSGSRITGEGLAGLEAELPRLRKLALDRCPGLTDDGVAALGALQDLAAVALSGAPGVTDAGLEALATHPGLKAVWLGAGLGITADGIQALREAVPQVVATVTYPAR